MGEDFAPSSMIGRDIVEEYGGAIERRFPGFGAALAGRAGMGR